MNLHSASRRLTLAVRVAAPAGAKGDRVRARLAGFYPHAPVGALLRAGGAVRRLAS